MYVQSCELYVCAHVAASTMESKKLLILASIRQPMADHSNKVTHTQIQYIVSIGLKTGSSLKKSFIV